MTRKIYRTAQGKIVDMGALQLQNEQVRAVGNMNVNARGDMIDSQNKPIATRNKQVARQYQKQVSNVQDTPVYASRQQVPAENAVVADNVQHMPAETQPATDSAVESVGGLAGAIARARSIKQEPMSAHGRTTGFKKI